jgi:2-polyprenyl-3-methyl-5-hydroxy-6-metoxy-1,4-benzoquinol methylase
MIEYQLVERTCPVCNNDNTKIIGIRGNREYNGADPSAEPHIFTNVVRCKTCDMIYTNPEIRGLEYLEENHYNDPDNYMKKMGEAIHKMFASRIRLIRNYIRPEQHTLLDIGAGKGEFLKVAEQSGFNATGIEPSAGFCEFARNQLGVNVIQGLLGSVEAIRNEKFDVVTMNHVLEHVEHPVNLLNQVHEYLDNKGVLFIEVPNCNSYLAQLADLFFRLRGLQWSSRLSPLHPPFHKFGHTKKSIRFLLEKCGYRLVACKTFSGKDRSSFTQKGWKYKAAAFFSDIFNLIGNRELLCVVAEEAG